MRHLATNCPIPLPAVLFFTVIFLCDQVTRLEKSILYRLPIIMKEMSLFFSARRTVCWLTPNSRAASDTETRIIFFSGTVVVGVIDNIRLAFVYTILHNISHETRFVKVVGVRFTERLYMGEKYIDKNNKFC